MDLKPSVSCVFVCHDGAGRILLARRSAGARDEPGRWDCGAGALEFGETFEEAVTREVTEEYTTAPLTVDLRGVRNVLRADPPSHWVAVVFAVRVDPPAVRIGEPHKFDDLRWFDPGDLPAPLHSQLPATLELVGDGLDHGGGFLAQCGCGPSQPQCGIGARAGTTDPGGDSSMTSSVAHRM